MGANRTTIAFVDDHPILLRGVADLFVQHPDFEVVGLGGTAFDAMALMQEKSPEILCPTHGENYRPPPYAAHDDNRIQFVAGLGMPIHHAFAAGKGKEAALERYGNTVEHSAVLTALTPA